MTYSNDLAALIESNSPAELALDFLTLVGRLKEIGATVFPSGQKLPKNYQYIFHWEAKGTPIVFFGTEYLIHPVGGKEVLPYSYYVCTGFDIKWKHHFDEKKLVFTPYISIENNGGGRFGDCPQFDEMLKNLSDILPPVVEVEMPDTTVTLPVPQWTKALSDDSWAGFGCISITMYKAEGQAMLVAYIEQANAVLNA